MQALYFPPAELPAGYVHDGAPLWQKTILVSGYDVNGTLFLEPRGKQSFLEQNTADPTNEESAPKKKRKLTKQSVMAGYAPASLFPGSATYPLRSKRLWSSTSFLCPG